MFESLWFTVTLLLTVHTHGALAANDIDEKVAIVIFAILIAIFTGIALVFAFLIIRLKRQDWQAVRDQYDAPHVNKRHSGIVRINSDQGITGFNQRQEPGLDSGVYERKTASDFSAVYINPGYSNDIDSVLVTTTTSTFQQPNGKEELPQDSTAVPNHGNTQNTSNGGHFITMNVSVVNEDTQAHTETENVSSTAVDEKSDNKLPTTNGDIAVPTDNDKDVDSDKNRKSFSSIANGVAGDGKTHSLVAESHQDPTASNSTAKRKSFGGLFKRQESQESQKPLLFSQSSTVSSLSAESPAVGGLAHQMSSSALPDTFNERDEQENEESEL